MNRSGYSDECEFLDLYRANVERAIAGKRGQAFLRELAAAMDAMPVKRLIPEELEINGEVCALGAIGVKRGLDMSDVDVYNPSDVAKLFGVARCLAAEIEYINDEDWSAPANETPEQRWARVRRWVENNIVRPKEGA